MSIEKYKDYLIENKTDSKRITDLIVSLINLDKVLQSEGCDINSLPKGRLVKYTEQLVESNPEEVAHLVSALYGYGNFSENFYYAEEVIDIAESYTAMDNLYTRVGDLHGEEIRDNVFKDLSIPPLGIHPEKKPEFTKMVIKRLEDEIGEEKTIEILKPCLHSRPMDPIQKDRERFLKLGNLDEFLNEKREDIINQAKKHLKDGTYWFAQAVDDQVLVYVKNTPTVAVGIRKDREIIVTKIPYQIKKYLNTDSENMKKFYACYCPWVRGALKKGQEQEISKNFCNCSGGFFKMYWDIIFDYDVEVELLESPLLGHTICKFAIKIPKKIPLLKDK